ncbi:methionine--tRNA ligase [Prochlorococcus sp. MIT 1300]|uniref:methionine--tRNA ligase n=1 Tax=Prochlorococcus sp. MIT 1300 TaxID=3096218 RepID=UPI002A7607F8|nr:methionine--tRNA ligase [Prochlorococcus sp. MIT 1300]
MKFTITTPLYYVNDKPHLGSLYTTLACDTISRFHRLEGNEVIFITGVDEHGQKILRTAESKNLTPKEHCDIICTKYKELWHLWDISYDRFVRTTDNLHKPIVESFFKIVEASGDIYIGRQQGWYCVGCEEYKDVESNSEEPICPIHNRKLEWRDEENLFFRLSKYQSQIEQLISKEGFILPKSRKNEIENFVKKGLRDFSISRVDLPWGIEVPGYKQHTFYVWFDALIGYLSALNPSGENITLNQLKSHGWPASVHVIGKDILRFHAVYWPAMLISAGLPLPAQVFGHGFLTREGQKMGKSLGNVLDPNELYHKYGQDAVRWYLLKDFQFGHDGDFQEQRFVELINNDLSNTIGNLLNRTISMSIKWFNNQTPTINHEEIAYHPLNEQLSKIIDEYRTTMSTLQISRSAELILNIATLANIYLNEKEPWAKIKDKANANEVAKDIYCVLEATRIVGVMLNPLLPQLSHRILAQLNFVIDDTHWTQSLRWGLLRTKEQLSKPIPVMQKLELQNES